MIGIDFDAAKVLSESISSLNDQCEKDKSAFDLAKSKVSSMPSGFVSTTMPIENEIDTLFDTIKKAIESTVSAFDACIENYYQFEVNGEKPKGAEWASILSTIKAENSFYWSYPEAAGTIKRVSDERLKELFETYGAIRNGNTYSFNLDGEEYQYNISSKVLTYGGGKKVNVSFLASDDADFNDIKNTITFLGGTGERESGSVSYIDGESISNGSLVIVPYPGDKNVNMSKNPEAVISSTKTGEFLGGGNTYNSIVGYSEGAQSAFGAVAGSNNLYDNCVIVNGSAYWTKDNTNLITRNGNYDAFKDMEIIFIESKNNNNWNPTIKQTVNDLVSNGVSKDNIFFFTNDGELNNFIDSKGIGKNEMPDSYSGHGSGWNMIKDSNIISYLSDKS